MQFRTLGGALTCILVIVLESALAQREGWDTHSWLIVPALLLAVALGALVSAVETRLTGGQGAFVLLISRVGLPSRALLVLGILLIAAAFPTFIIIGQKWVFAKQHDPNSGWLVVLPPGIMFWLGSQLVSMSFRPLQSRSPGR